MRGRPSHYWNIALGALAISFAAPVVAHELPGASSQGTIPYAVDEMGSDNTVPFIDRGSQIAIACDALDKASADNVRVVMRIAPTLGDLDTGYKKVLATDETVSNGAVHVRVPDVPDLASHTVQVNVYVTKASGQQLTCDAGTMRVV
ncbi:MAG TPA: hypothetical protein VH000_11090 [Rhizomicrobium sp.]|jgi:hypothetical protein|nr:hypothetical protein [Rhizomicrobium sp.]HEX4534767.1 hypothetical protein [Rhizomicrobium sp.]